MTAPSTWFLRCVGVDDRAAFERVDDADHLDVAGRSTATSAHVAT